MTKWFWDALVAIARIYVDNGHPILGTLLVLALAFLPLMGLIAVALLQ